jgi:KipI family sensor histidine kinase inhibitor
VAGKRRPRQHHLAASYGGDAGPDLEEVADRLGLTTAEVVARHTARTYTVLATGFAPGFVYLGPLPPSLRLPRRDEPRVAVPAGSVAIADAQTGVYGVRSGGGWWLIGCTTAATFRPEKRPPTAFSIGDRVTFEALG